MPLSRTWIRICSEVASANLDLRLIAPGGVLPGVLEQVGERDADQTWIRASLDPGCDGELCSPPWLTRAQLLGQLLDDAGHVDGGGAQCRSRRLGQAKHVAHEVANGLGRCRQVLDVLLRLLFAGTGAQEVDPENQSLQRIVEIVHETIIERAQVGVGKAKVLRPLCHELFQVLALSFEPAPERGAGRAGLRRD